MHSTGSTPLPAPRADAWPEIDRPERLAAGLRAVRPGYGLAGLTLGLLALGAIAASALIEVPLTVKGSGLLMSSKGVLEIAVASDHEGRIVELLVDVGQRVSPDQELARIVQPTLTNDLKLARQERALVLDEMERMRRFQHTVMRRTDEVRRQQDESAHESIALLESRLKILEKLAENLETMLQGGRTTVDRLLTVRADLTEARDRIATRRGEMLEHRVTRAEKEAQFERDYQALEARLAQAESQIDRTEDKLRQQTVIRSTQSGIVSEWKAMPGDLVQINAPILTLLPVDESFHEIRPDAAKLVATILVPAKDGKKIRSGMDALVEPASVRRDVYGAIEGTVERVSIVPAGSDQLRQMLRNDDLVRKLTENGPAFLVSVALARDPTTASGFRWTSSKGPDAEITTGTVFEAAVETERVPMLALVVPAIKELMRSFSESRRHKEVTRS